MTKNPRHRNYTWNPIITTSCHKCRLISKSIINISSQTGPFASALANRYGFRSVTIVGAFIGGLAFFLSSYATSINYLCLTYGILGGKWKVSFSSLVTGFRASLADHFAISSFDASRRWPKVKTSLVPPRSTWTWILETRFVTRVPSIFCN